MKRGSSLVEGEGSCDMGAALAGDPALVEGGDVLPEPALPADLLQEVPRPQQPLCHICERRATAVDQLVSCGPRS